MAINNFNVGVGTTSQLTRYRYVATGGETSISGTDADGKTLSYTVGLEQVFLNGVNLVRGQDYTATNGTSIGSLTALVASDSLEVFAYVPFNIANALTVSTVDAKGDLLVGTAADTVGRLAVGTDNAVLIAASGESTGLKWDNPGPVFKAQITADQTIASQSTATKVTFNNEIIDTNNCYDPTTNYRFTPNKAGYYMFVVTLAVNQTTSAFEYAYIYKNGVLGTANYVNGTDLSISASHLFYMNGTTDYVECYVALNGNATRIVYSGIYSNFIGTWLRS